MSNLAIVSTGDEAEDRKQLERAQTFDDRIKQGICANGCMEMAWQTEYTAICHVCGFLYSTNVPYGKEAIEQVM